MTSPRRARPPQLDQKIRLRSTPTAPTIRRIQPIATRSTPDTVASTAQTRIAPAASKTRLIPIPIPSPFFGGVEPLPSSRPNTPLEQPLLLLRLGEELEEEPDDDPEHHERPLDEHHSAS